MSTMASSGSVFSETLHAITSTKLEELAKQRSSFEDKYAALMASASREYDPVQRLFLLVEGAKSFSDVQTVPSKGIRGRALCGSSANPRLEIDLKTLNRFIEQARYDPSTSPKVLADWEKSIRQYLSVHSSRYQYADLYGKLVTEWLSSEESAPANRDVETDKTFEDLFGAKKKARTEWKKVVFEPAHIDVQHLKYYLVKLFDSDKRNVASSVSNLRAKVKAFEGELGKRDQFNIDNLRSVVGDLQSSDLLSNEKREVLKDFLSNNFILTEIANVLNMRMAGLERWSWGDHVPLEQRREKNGAYSIHMHEDLLQTIFLHYIGVKWSVFFKGAFESLMREAWTSKHADMSPTDSTRRRYYLGPNGVHQGPNLEHERSERYMKNYFVCGLLDHKEPQIKIEEGEEEVQLSHHSRKRIRQDDDIVEPVSQMHSFQEPLQSHTQSLQTPNVQMEQSQAQAQSAQGHDRYGQVLANSNGNDGRDQAKNPMQAKQHLLHILSAEILLNSRLHGEITCLHSVFESWNPLLPHETVLIVLRYFGVSDKWYSFFKSFLQAPLKFADEPSAKPRLRRRGMPGSHTLSDVFREVTLVCLDFSVNQATSGGLLYRLYDDIWFWSKDYEQCAKAWAAVIESTQAMGVMINKSKTGSVRVARDSQVQLYIDNRLPIGEVRWGFLRLDSTSGRWEIDETIVDAHIEELRTQLQGKSSSVIGWIQAWNGYTANLFSSEFGQAANCFGRGHVDQMLATHRRIQEKIFNGGSVVEFIKEMIKDRFGVEDIPDGFLFFPVELGGLDLVSPFVALLQIRESVQENPYDIFDAHEKQERDDYANCQRRFDRGEVDNQRGKRRANFQPALGVSTHFFTFEEFVKYREEYAPQGFANLIQVYHALLRQPVEKSIHVSEQVKHAVEQLRGQSNLRGIKGEWESMEAYWKWVTQMYGPDVVERFGRLNVVEPGLLPLNMVSLLREKTTKWQG